MIKTPVYEEIELQKGRPGGIAGLNSAGNISSSVGAELSANRDAANGYAGLTGSRVTKGIDTTDELVIDSATRGLVLKSPNGTYFRVTIDNAGAFVVANLGSTKP